MEHLAYNHETCQKSLNAIDDALYAIGGKWKLKINIAMQDGHTRFNDLQRALGISAKMLSQELKDLELNGFLERKVHTGTPVVVEYQVTEYSDSLQDILKALSKWGENHRTKIKSERS